MEDTTHHQRTYRHESFIMFLVMVDVELNGPSGRMLEAHVTNHVPRPLLIFVLEHFVIFESGPFSIHIQPISLQIYLQPPSVTNYVPILYLTY